ncbi:sensor domain-containing diguanylate cyclase [Paenibacillus kobensis]|uniref:sensor domain-containing diguanylate cyclase n=1 Tax=Paenibacillus kobensis TaxID=59841 RepID=UPI000FDC31A7|nr:diguanylate cyclase [Paenibacillus kobensis]
MTTTVRVAARAHAWSIHLRLLMVMVIGVTIILGVMASAANAASADRAVRGLLELPQQSSDSVTLDGQWAFYWKRLLSPEEMGKAAPDGFAEVPAAWNKSKLPGGRPSTNGYATYTLHIEHTEPGKVWALDMPPLPSAYKLWVNGKLLVSSGTLGTAAGHSSGHSERRVVVFQSDESSIDIVMQMSNFMHPRSGITKSIRLGDPDTVMHKRQTRLSLELFVSGALFIMAVYHFGLFAMRRNRRAPLYFGLYCFVIALRSLVVGETAIYTFIPSLHWVLAVKTEYLCLSVSLAAMTLFVRKIYPCDMSVAVCRAIVSVSAVYSAIIVLTPPTIFTHLLTYFQIVIALTISYGMYVFGLAIARKREGSVLTAIGALLLAASIFNDILYYRGLLQTGNYVTFGLFAFIVAQSFILANQFSKSFAQSEDLAHELKQLNYSLEQKVKERTQELESINELLSIQSLRDGLTGIANRRFFNDISKSMLDKAVQEQSPLSLLLVDIDYFKKYNDTYGHLHGDDCLKQVAEVLQEGAKAHGGLAARYGGEEFALLVPLGSTEAAELADELVGRVRALGIPHEASAAAPVVTISCGVMSYDADGSNYKQPPSITAMIEAADQVLYEAKNSGRNRYRVGV